MGSVKPIYRKAGHAPLSVRMLGEFEVWLDGVRLPNAAFGRPKTQALLKLLLRDRGEIFSAESLVDKLFRELGLDKALKNLHARISELRYALEPELERGIDSAYIQRVSPGCYRFNPAASVWLDTEAFEHQLSLAQNQQQNGLNEDAVAAFQTALKLYRGPFLAQDVYEDWTISTRDVLERDYENALLSVAKLHNAMVNYQQAVACCDQGLVQNAYNEHFYQEKMKALSSLGQQREADNVFAQCRGALKRIDATPAIETVRIHQSLKRRNNAWSTPNRKAAQLQKALLKGRFLIGRSTASAALQAYEKFQQAISLDPESADAHAGLADVHSNLVIYHQSALKNHIESAKRAALKAIKLDASSPAANTAFGLVLMNFEWDGPKALRYLNRAIELDPSSPPAYLRLAALKAVWGDRDEALSLAYRAHEIDPLSIEVYMGIARICYLMEETDGVIDVARQALELEPRSYRAHQFLGQAHDLQSRPKLALHHFQRAAEISGGATSDLVALGHTYAQAGNRPEAERVFSKMQSVSNQQFVSPYHLAVVLAGMQEYQLAVDHLEQARIQKSWPLVLAGSEPRMAKLRSTSAYKAWANNWN